MKNNWILHHAAITIGVILAVCKPVGAYDNKTVHMKINQAAGSQPSLSNYITDNLGYPEGIGKEFVGNEIIWWLQEGGKDEDNNIRFLRHFHDPLKSWDQAGLWGNDSALVWAQRPDQSILGTYSWVTARDSFYHALTTGSETDFATTFRSLGQVMHLVSDMAVPAHVRNDPHPFSDTYEDWTTEHQKEFQYVNNKPVDLSIFSNPAPSHVASLPISALWDKDIYDGSNPDRLWSMNAGLAEFTNANFLSRDTFGEYPHPNFTDPSLLYEIQWHDRPTVMADDNKADSPAYIWRLVGGQQKHRLAAANYFAIETDDGLVSGFNKTLDDEVNKDYARELIPRAIGYSTALLDYFFRGDIDLKPESAGGYSLVNNTSENMTGTFALYYDDKSGTRHKLPGGEWLSTTVAANGRIPVGNIAIPADHANPAKYFLVFKGKMGGEDGAVAGRSVSLKTSGLLAIKIYGNLYNAKGNPSGGAGPTTYIVWDVGQNAPLVLPKTGGGVWDYPLAAEDYAGSWLADLKLVFGAEVTITGTGQLFTTRSNVRSNIPFNPKECGTGFSGGSGGALKFSLGSCLPSCTCYCGRAGFRQEKFFTVFSGDGSEVIYGYPISSWDYHRCLNYSANTYSYALPIEASGVVANNYGVPDQFDWSGTLTGGHYDNRVSLWQMDAGGLQTVTINDNGATKGDTSGVFPRITFSLPLGGAHAAMFLGYPHQEATPFYIKDVTSNSRATTALPVPAIGNAVALTCNNASGAPVTVIGPAITYSGSMDSDHQEHEQFDSGQSMWSYSGSTAATGIGSLTAIDGVTIPISLDYLEKYSLEFECASTDQKALDSYVGNRRVGFATDSIHVGSALDTEDNLIAMIAVESVSSGAGATVLSPMVPPLTSKSKGTEGAPVYSSLSNSYHIRAICAAVEDAKTKNPWELPDNSGLIDELQRAIARYVNAYPPGGNNHWNISTDIYKVQ